MSGIKTQNGVIKHKKRKMLLSVKHKHFLEAHNMASNWRSVWRHTIWQITGGVSGGTQYGK
jgi:hypothetical protein